MSSIALWLATSEFPFLFFSVLVLTCYWLIPYERKGVFRVGVITFEVSISVNNSSLKPKFSEIADFIAHELDIQSAQASL
jgi:hypothetical protein